MIGKAITLHYGLPDDEKLLLLEGRVKPHPDVPKIAIIHDDHPMLKSPEELEKSKLQYKSKDVIFLVRDPRDVIVSSYFEMNKRGQLFGENPYESRRTYFEGSLQEFINRRNGGFDTILRYYSIWAENRHVPNQFLLIRYEDIKFNPFKELKKVLDFLKLSDISEETINQAVKYASFENMRKLEKFGYFQTGILSPSNPDDKDSYKTRKGKIGGYLDYLSDEEIAELNKKMQISLPSYYKYEVSPTDIE